MPLISERTFDSMRWRLRRAVAPVLKQRHGYPFVYRRVLLDRLKRATRDEHTVQGFEFVSFDSLEQRGGVVQEIHAQERVTFEPPPGLDPWLRGAPGWTLDHAVPPQRVVQLSDGVVFGREGWVGPTSAAICPDLGNAVSRNPVLVARAAHQALESDLVTLSGTTVSLLQHHGSNYFHWMMQGLPRLALALDAVGVSAIDRFLIDPQPPPFVLETLDRAGIPRDRLLRVDHPVPAYRSERLVAATMLPHYVPPPSWATGFVRGLFASSLGSDDRSLIYISREGRERRRLVNEDNVLDVLRPYGFRAVAMERRTVAEQSALFAGARCIVAAHGAALTNAVFARRDTPVLELLPANTTSAIYALLASQLGLRYRVLVGSEARPLRRLRTWMADADLIVDTHGLAATLSGLLSPFGRSS